MNKRQDMQLQTFKLKISLSASNRISHRYTKKQISICNSNVYRIGIPPCIRLKGSFTLEAAVVLPVFAVCVLSILMFFKSMEVEQQLEASLIQAAREAAVVSLDDEQLDITKLTSLFYFHASQKKSVDKFLRDGIWNVQVEEVTIENHELVMRITYPFRFPIGLGQSHSLIMENRIKCRIWDGDSVLEQTSSDPYVYITSYGSVYHIKKDCRHIRISASGISISELSGRRNLDGSKYYPCSCIEEQIEGMTVYITDYGNRYHKNSGCSDLKREVKRVRQIDLPGWRACLTCGGGA